MILISCSILRDESVAYVTYAGAAPAGFFFPDFETIARFPYWCAIYFDFQNTVKGSVGLQRVTRVYVVNTERS